MPDGKAGSVSRARSNRTGGNRDPILRLVDVEKTLDGRKVIDGVT